jgi:hypothetical protein
VVVGIEIGEPDLVRGLEDDRRGRHSILLGRYILRDRRRTRNGCLIGTAARPILVTLANEDRRAGRYVFGDLAAGRAAILPLTAPDGIVS